MAVAIAAETLDWKLATAPVALKLVHCFQPLTDPRWDIFLQGHPNASVFHSSPWLEALNKTYGYEVVAYTTSADTQELENALVFCRVRSWLTGSRIVSLPFSDHCEPLVSSENAAAIVAEILKQEFDRDKRGYLEVRPLERFELVNQPRRTAIPYLFHQLDLTPDIDVIVRKFHKSSVQRKIHKAETGKLAYGEGTTDALLDQFYDLFKQTRKRHRIPPPPRQWFVNLMRSFGDALRIRLAYKNDRAVAAMITLRYKDTLVYKYGASDPEFHRFGAMHLLYWRAIQEAKMLGLRQFDFGRTDADQHGLITFKSRWGAQQSPLTYSRYSVSGSSTHFFDLPAAKWKSRVAKYAVSHLPYSLVSRIGQVLYPHIA
jgi:lipid II:glycine glycyltransferase (peptidoglycan interpeptide bridge formation enzyme)